MQEKITIQNALEGSNKKTVNDALFIAASHSHVELKIINEVKSFFEYTAYFSTTGTIEQVKHFGKILTTIEEDHNSYIDEKNSAFNNAYQEIEEFKILKKLKHYKVSSIETHQSCENNFEITMKTHRFSSVGNLGHDLKKALKLDINVHENSNLLKKEVRFTARGTPQQFNKFKEIFLNHVKSKNPVAENDFLDIYTSNKKRVR